jgi:hypothetical protein
MADKYDPTTDIHNLFIFLLVPLIIRTGLSTNYMEYMRIPAQIIIFAIFYLLPMVIYYYYNFFEIFGKTLSVFIYIGLPCLLLFVLVTIILFMKKFVKKFGIDIKDIKEIGIILFVIYDFVINIYYYSYFCEMTFKTYI